MASISFAEILVALVAIAVVVSMLLFYRSLREADTWSLTDALSEDVVLTKTDDQGNPVDASGNALMAGTPPLTVTVMKASSSRFIAMIGTVAILMLYVGFGLACLYRFTSMGVIPDMSQGSNFFYSGIVLFAPYLINKFSSVFSIFKP
ncbi:hypothetical protein ASE04_09180 [Rhizobium sp. Root708]|uniref:hypothetical protein n=1 Tax=Rhizobium sp. Root708 TaxID=1736592 RepID=UPI0006FF36C6|nr:hypothetical protein [Rhizobium sp. Root708]KRB51704.1 hypothetical protein ASE04_09180 [Rhizobium sp. Root708]